MSADPPSTDPERFRYYITDIELQPPITDPNCKICVKVFVDDELVCSLPWLGNTQQLRWPRLITCEVSPVSRISLKLFRNLNEKHRSFYFPSYYTPEVDEGTGETTLEHPELIWAATITSLTPTPWRSGSSFFQAEKLFSNELDKLSHIDGIYDSLKPDETTKYLFKTALKFAKIVAETLAIEPAKLSFLLLLKTWELLERQVRLDDIIRQLLLGFFRVQEVLDVLDQASNSMLTTAMDQSKEPIGGILTLLEDISIFIFNRLADGQARGSDAESSPDDTQGVEAYLNRLEELQEAFHDSWTPSIPTYLEPTAVEDNESPGLAWYEVPASITESATKQQDPYETLNLLRPMDPSGYDPDRACLDGTRDAVINRLITWSQNRENSESFMWISGQVGMGKTALATSLCQKLDEMRVLVGSFFCRRGDPGTNDPLWLINNIVHSIALRFPAYAYEVVSAIRSDRSLCNAHLSLRYEGLVKKPLERLKSLSIPTTLVLVVDGLDVCGDYDSRGKIIQKLYDMSQLVPWLKVIFTARPVGDIQECFHKNCSKEPMIHIHNYDASNDIRAYIQSRLGDIAQEEGWLGNSIEKLCTAAQGVFLWAALAVKYIKRSTLPASSHVQKLLNNHKSPVTDHFDALYSSILDSVFDGDEDETRNAYSHCIGVILSTSAHKSLAIPDLQYLLLDAGKIHRMTLDRILKSLGPLLLINDKYARFHHTSFQDYIANSSRSGDFVVRLDQYEAEPAACCLQLIQRDLRFNICKLESSKLLNKDVSGLQARIQSNITPALKYACTHWIDHFIASPNQNLVAALRKFMEGPQLMYWIELLGLLDRIDLAIIGLSKLASLELAQCEEWRTIVPWIKDVHRFILSFNDAISASTPHLYISALAFAPTESLTVQRMRPYFPNTITISQGADSNWHPCIKSILHPHAVQSLSVSPDGRRVIVGYSDGSLSVWDRVAGAFANCNEPVVGHTNLVTCVVFSHDGDLVATSSYDATVRVWDVNSCLKTCYVLTGHIGPVHSVAFSPKSAVVASGSSDKTIRIWSTKSMRPISEPYDGHLSRVSSVVFSPDGRKLVSGSWDRTIRVWSVDPVNQALSGTPLVISEHSDSVTCVAFSPDGSRIVSGSSDKTIRAYDVPSGHDIVSSTALAKHLDGVTSIAFSPDGKLIASSSLDGMIKLHDATTFTEVSRPFGHSNAVNHIAFSPDGAYIVSGSADMTTRVWRFSTRRICKPMAVGPLVGHSSYVYSIALSNDGAKILSGSSDNTVRLWDAYTGAPIGDPLVGHSNTVYCVAFSHDGTRAVSGSSDGTAKLWDTTTHAVIHSHQFGSHVWCIAFSPDSSLTALGAQDGKVYLWESTDWKIVGNPLLGHSRHVLSVVFSPDGACIASSSADHTIILWDTKTQGRLGNALQGHTDYVRSVSFSPCGARLVSGSDDQTLKVWDIKTGNMIRQLAGHSNLVMSVAFSPDGVRVGSGSCDNTVRFWDGKTGEMIGQPFKGHSGYVRSVAFSPDGGYLISGSDDNTIRIWNLGISSEPPAGGFSNDLPGTFCWPSSSETPPYPRDPGWVAHEQQPLAFWLPAHYRQPDQFLSPHISAPCLKPLLDYSRFAYGTDWTSVACDYIKNSSK